ncbi:ATP-binding cassette domain-containing protein [Cereibacter sphaeroides]|uniref:ATP-binding cassette domain-containing protein n=1 Tax=Cereibacter sphaeroides TaxID=1063 RepID=UPI001F259D36|nr:ATP-binding cassette domain-containing protein [Cereibacter sphaeroides]MCE6967389.1 ATP-binding cassette domain-containing protein [Cereibacter sphaeroides]
MSRCQATAEARAGSEDFGLEGTAWLGNRPLFRDVRLDLPPGWTCLLGASGAGKSTILRLLAGLPTGAHFEGRIRAPERVAWMAQEDLLQPRLGVLGNVLLGCRLRGEAADAARARALLASVGLEGMEDRAPASLSGGQRQRVALARALMERAPLALLDEPFSALDAGTRRRMQDLARAQLSGAAVLLVTHDPMEALRLGDRVWLLSRAGLEPVDTPPDAPPRSLQSLAAASEALMARLA